MRLDDYSMLVDGLEVRVLATASGPETTFVLVHGLGVAASYFEPLAERLAPQGRVVAVNLPGFGATKDPDRTLPIGKYAKVARAAVARLGVQRAVWVGHSMGTQVVVEAVNQEQGLASRVVLLSPVVNRRERSARVLAWRFARSAARESLPSAAASVRAWFAGGIGPMLRTFPIMLAYPIEERIASVGCDLLLVTGDLDEMAPRRWLDELAANAGGAARVVVVDGAAHQAMFTRAGTVADLIVAPPTPAPQQPPLSVEEWNAEP